MRNLADPRSSSTHSLLPSSRSSSQTDNRRTLLIIYIHGFMGNDSSFRSFPAHVHNYLKEALAETHVIHTKIYPRYKTYKSIDVACENFSRWLAPHESSTTDVVLVGHSMGGLLAADVVLMPSNNYSPNVSPFRHRILGIICLDAPLLGLHPGIVLSGIASLFRPAPAPPPPGEGKADRASFDSHPPRALSPDPSIYEQVRPPSDAPSPTLAPVPGDPTYNPTFFNDVAFVDRGWLKNIAHFANKHRQENLVEAAANHIMSHLEFGGCLADYPGLRTRYTRARMLEDVDELTQPADKNLVRVRFANYYTVSTGLPKKPKPGKKSGHGEESTDTNQLTTTSSKPSSMGVTSPRISIEPPREDHPQEKEDREHPLQLLDPIPITEEDHRTPSPSPGSEHSALSFEPSQAPGPDVDDQIPPLPTPPIPPDLSCIPDKDSRRAAEKEYKSVRKAYEEALKAREKLIKTQQKLQEKARKESEKSRKETEKQEKEFKKSRKKSEEKIQKQEDKEDKKLRKEDGKARKEEEKLRREEEKNKTPNKKQKKKKEKLGKFCMLPPEGEKDKTWVQVYMQDMDEVTAHCGLFMADRPDYERLVGDVGERIAGWVEEDGSRRVLFEEMGRVD
ncbi:hypothetical protein QBC44DRAFT_340007 [Cladorrhinum sp. PSN332]|nr:hypothetical protein QBC44DRAFT_340007 [Cladorrhinum sp. PSN332]